MADNAKKGPWPKRDETLDYAATKGAAARRQSDGTPMDDRPGDIRPPASPSLRERFRPRPLQRPSRTRVIWIVLGLLAIAALAWIIFRPHTQPARASRANTPMPVGTAEAQQGDMPVTLNALGTVTPLATVTVRDADQRPADRRSPSRKARWSRRATSSPRSTRAPIRWRSTRRRASWRNDQALLAERQASILQRYQDAWSPQNSIAQQQPRHAGRAGAAGRRRPSTADQAQVDNAKAQPRLLPHRRAGDRPRRPAPGRSRQLRADQRRQRHRRHHPAAADLGDLHPARGQSAARS